MPRPILYVLDGTATLCRAYFAAEKLTSPDGVEVGGVSAFCQILGKFVRQVQPTYVAMVFDSPRGTFRHDLYADYKANRTERPEDLTHQFELAWDMAGSLGFLRFREEGYEADDLMATLARRGREAGIGTVLVTPDKDILQLIGPDVLAMDPKTYAYVDDDGVRERFGVPAARLRDFLALAGDASDNVPGVPGVGPKAARALINEIGDLDAIYADLSRVATLDVRGAKGLARKLEEHREQAFLSRALVALCDTVELDDTLTLGALRYRGPAREARSTASGLGVGTNLGAFHEAAAPPF